MNRRLTDEQLGVLHVMVTHGVYLVRGNTGLGGTTKWNYTLTPEGGIVTALPIHPRVPNHLIEVAFIAVMRDADKRPVTDYLGRQQYCLTAEARRAYADAMQRKLLRVALRDISEAEKEETR